MPAPKLFQSLVKRIYRLRRDPIVARRLGIRLLLDPRNWIDNRVLAGAPYEVEQLAMARKLIAEHRLEAFLDVGANIGLYTVLLGLHPQIREVISYEPMRRNYAQLMANVFLNGLEHKVQTHRLALGETTGRADLHIDPTSTGLSRIDLAGAERDSRVFIQRESIEIVRFDDHQPIEGRRFFLKVDAEGHAAGVLRGMRRFLEKNHVVIQVELTGVEREPARAFFEEIAYKRIAALEMDEYFVPGK